MDSSKFDPKTFVDREFVETEDGRYDRNGFFRLPDKSYWDPDGIYFNSDGFDKHGGYYDDNCEYHPGKGWIAELMCYEDEADKQVSPNDELDDDFEGEDDYNEFDDLFDNVDDDILGGDNPRNYNKGGNRSGNQFNNQYSESLYNNPNYQPAHPNARERKTEPNTGANKGFYDYQRDQNPNNYLKNSNVEEKKKKEQEDFEKEYPNLNLKGNIPKNPTINVFNKIPDNLAEKSKTETTSNTNTTVNASVTVEARVEEGNKGKRQETTIDMDSLFG